MKKDNTKIAVNTFNWGPCLIKLSILDDFRKILLDEAKKTEMDFSDKLAGQIAKERGYTQKQREIIIPHLSPYLGVYDECYQRYTNKKYKHKPEYALTALWCNFQRQFEFNPPHDHDGKLSFVIYLSIPDKLRKENEAYKGKSSGPGGIQFMYGEGPRDCISYMSAFPKEGDMYIFPAWLKHWVSPFQSDCVRVSVSGNVHDSAPISQIKKDMLKDNEDEEYLKELEKKTMMDDRDIEEFHNIGKSIKKNSKYNYLDATRIEEHGTRLYDVNGTRLPSVTTILGKTKDQQFIKDWKAKVGEKEADRIKNLSSNRGTAMHKFLEHYILGTGYDDLTGLGQEAKAMAEKVIEYGLTPVEEWYGSEVTLYYPGLYAGSTDLVCLHDGLETIVDFKQSNRPKKKEWIEDYYLQIAAYAMAHDYVHGSAIRQGVIMMCTPDLYYQEFRITDHELRSYKHKFLKRLNMYHDLIFDEKEKADVKIEAGDFEKRDT